MDLVQGGPQLRAGTAPGRERPPLRVLLPSSDEMEHHARVLAGIDKESKGQCLWLKADAPEGTTTAS